MSNETPTTLTLAVQPPSGLNEKLITGILVKYADYRGKHIANFDPGIVPIIFLITQESLNDKVH